ncbi:MAG: acetyl-CoA carboxylase biotin carboxyl carrier protein [Candidatus Omnitrophota bacterium]|nr:acetyl-CoA carboxylase biotin carboxyl carrier protein [Candidatus Omnitrophota bacterium]
MNIKEIREMINLMNENNLAEFEFEKEGLKIRLKKEQEGRVESIIGPNVIPPPARQEPAPQKKAGSVEIKSPMVGTFYKSPSPDAPPFVGAGDIVEVDQVVCIIEAMKLMNEIKSEIKGKVTAVLVENAEPVEFGQALFSVEPV